jgi:hypothetical protein
MRIVEFQLDCNGHIDEEDGWTITAYTLDEDEFKSPEHFDSFVEWAVDMLRRLHKTGDGIAKVIVSKTPVLEEYDV